MEMLEGEHSLEGTWIAFTDWEYDLEVCEE
jgi:hypothetical protein